MATTRHHGAVMADILASLAITAVIMLATGVATQSVCETAASNEAQFTATQTARQLAQGLAQNIRSAVACDLGGDGTADRTIAGTVLYVQPQEGDVRAYVHDPDNNRLLLDVKPAMPITASPDLNDIRSRMRGGTPSVFVMADNVTRLAFEGKYAKRPDKANPATEVATLVNVQVKMEITEAGQTLKFSESVVPRRTQQ